MLAREPQALASIARLMRGKILITGAARSEEAQGGERGGRRTRIFNSIEVVQGDKIIDFYDKIHLVPFGEYLPLDGLLRPLGVSHLVPGVWDRGAGPRRLSAPGLPPIAPLICYEAIFPGEAIEREAADKRPQWLLNLTNDGWFGMTQRTLSAFRPGAAAGDRGGAAAGARRQHRRFRDHRPLWADFERLAARRRRRAWTAACRKPRRRPSSPNMCAWIFPALLALTILGAGIGRLRA